jgi:hypothetical protein
MARYIGVDDLFLLRLASGDEIAQSIVDSAGDAGFPIIVPPAVYQALQDTADKDTDNETKVLAGKALSGLNLWGILPLELTETQIFYSDRAAEAIVEAGVLKESSLSKARMITQLGSEDVNADLFITGHSELCGANTYLMHFIAQARDLTVFPVREVDAFHKELEELRERVHKARAAAAAATAATQAKK